MRRAVRRLADSTDRLHRIVFTAKLVRPYRKLRFYHYGRASIIYKPNWIAGAGQISIGDSVMIFQGVWLSVERPARDRKPPVISIGDFAGLRPYVTISAAESIVIEDGVIISSFTTVIDSDHTFSAGRPNVMHNPLVSSPVRIGRGTWIGERVAVLRGSNIGQCCFIGANSVVRGTIPDYSIAVGAPARVVGSTKDSFPNA